MGYCEALEAAGATVHAFNYFGSYQGDWWAKVTYNGVTGWVHGYFGSCECCDAFAAEFGYFSENEPTKEALAEFGRSYLDDIITTDEAIAEASRHIEWDWNAREMVEFIKQHG